MRRKAEEAHVEKAVALEEAKSVAELSFGVGEDASAVGSGAETGVEVRTACRLETERRFKERIIICSLHRRSSTDFLKICIAETRPSIAQAIVQHRYIVTNMLFSEK